MSHDGEVNHTAAEFLFIFSLSGVFILGFRIQGPTLPAFILPHWGKLQAGGMAKGLTGQPGRRRAGVRET